MTDGPLSHIKVIDLAQARAGPTCVRVLADMGADVIQVVRPGRNPSQTALTNFDTENLHRNKRSIAVDLHKDEGRDLLLRLVKTADVLVENYRPDVKHRLGIDFETLSAINERLIYGSISGFGQTGPYAGRPGVDQIVQGMSGLMTVTGPPGSGPWRVGIAVADLAAGMFLAHGILVAIIERERSGRGQWVTTSLLESMIAMLDFQAARWLIGKEVPGQAGNDHPTVFPTGVFDTSDGQINIAATSDRMFRDFTAAIGLPALADDGRFKDPRARGRNREPLRELCQAKLVERTSSEWIEELNSVGVPCGPILTIDKAFEDPQVSYLHMAQEIESRHFGKLSLVRSPIGLSRTPPEVREAAPRPGEHTAEVLREQGLDAAEIASLAAKGVIGA